MPDPHDPITPTLELSRDGLHATLILPAGCHASEPLVQSILAERNVASSALHEDRLRTLLERAAADPEREHRDEIAVGVEPTAGSDSEFHLLGDIVRRMEETHQRLSALAQSDLPEPTEDGANTESGVDFYSLSAFIVVEMDELIGYRVPPAEGEDGMDVHGVSLPAPAPKSCAVVFHDSVRIEDSGEVRANRPGVLHTDASGVRVDAALEIRGSVDFSTGHVDFPGEVVVHDGVRDCFQIKTTGDLTVHKQVEAARLFVGRDARLERGMAAREKGSLLVQRDLHAGYLDNTDADVRRDAYVAREITNCTTKVGRHLISQTAVLMGGRTSVGGRCELLQVGSNAGVATELIVGHIEELESLAQRMAGLMPVLEERSAKTRDKLDRLQNATVKLTASQAEELTELQFELASVQQRTAPVVDSLEHVLETIQRVGDAEITVHRMLCAGVEIWIGVHHVEITNDLRGPLTIRLDDRGEPQIETDGQTSPLRQHAKVHTDDRFPDLVEIRRQIESSRAA